MGVVFFASGLLQAASSIASGRIAGRFGMLPTMVFTHLPSNVLLILVPFAPSFGLAIALWLARCSLSQMDVPARQAYVVALVDPQERLAASAYTNTARYVTRPIAPAIAGSLMQVATAAPFLLAGSLKIAYDLALFAMFRRVHLPDLPDG
jgi:predicted MFS family arabinose efflux permease